MLLQIIKKFGFLLSFPAVCLSLIFFVACGGAGSGGGDDDDNNENAGDDDSNDQDVDDDSTQNGSLSVGDAFGNASGLKGEEAENSNGDQSPSEVPTTGNADADRLAQAAAACGYQSKSTVPAGWDLVMMSDKGCSFWTPAGWLVEGEGQAVTSAFEDSQENVGFMAISAVDLSGNFDCTLTGVRDWLETQIGEGCSDSLQTLYYGERTIDIGDLSIPVADWIIGCMQGAASGVGYMFILGQTESMYPACYITVEGFWEPSSQIEEKTCMLTQIFNSVWCPSGGSGSCVDADCSAACAEEGYAGGACTSADECGCSND
jgi:hypothetical protein